MGLQNGSDSAASNSGSFEVSSGSSGCDGTGVEQDCTITLSASGGNADPDTGSIEIPITAAGSAPTAGDCCNLNEPDYSFSVIEVLSSISAEGPWESADSSLSILPDAAFPQQALLQGTLNRGADSIKSVSQLRLHGQLKSRITIVKTAPAAIPVRQKLSPPWLPIDLVPVVVKKQYQ
tara:strand:- start:1298 stop:1831 length:534 start_codon:yes stop_codon:yes gene_type:complete